MRSQPSWSGALSAKGVRRSWPAVAWDQFAARSVSRWPPAAPRVIRVRAPGLSPVSLLVLPGSAAVAMRLPALAPGGEVFGMLPAHAFLPETLFLTSERRTRTTIQPTASRSFQASGLPPGAYSLVPRYRGGLPGRPRPLVVRAGETAELLPLPLPETGAVSVRARPEICEAERLPMRIALQRVSDEGRRVEARALLEQRIDEPSCDRDWEGLAEGTYQVSLARAGESGALPLGGALCHPQGHARPGCARHAPGTGRRPRHVRRGPPRQRPQRVVRAGRPDLERIHRRRRRVRARPWAAGRLRRVGACDGRPAVAHRRALAPIGRAAGGPRAGRRHPRRARHSAARAPAERGRPTDVDRRQWLSAERNPVPR